MTTQRVGTMDRDGLRSWLRTYVAERLGRKPGEIDPHERFEEMGLTSTEVIAMSGELEEMLHQKLSPVLLYEKPSIEEIVGALLPDER